MLTRFSDFDRSFDVLDDFRKQMDRMFGDLDDRWGGARFAPTQLSANGPRVNVFDTGAELLVTADVPGLTEKELDITLHDGVLTLVGERKADAPEGYHVHRQERGSYRFKRSFALPAKVDPEKTAAVVKDGVLEVKLAKAAEARPRQIAVRSAQ
jgi:HSP20 family protein